MSIKKKTKIRIYLIFFQIEFSQDQKQESLSKKRKQDEKNLFFQYTPTSFLF